MNDDTRSTSVNKYTKTYEMVVPPEPAMSWDSYVEILNHEWKELLDNPKASEKDFQEYFERHPCCLPHPYPVWGRGAHGPYPGAIISQPVLPGFSRKIPDFLYITRDSTAIYAVLIEIENPQKKWATSDGQQTAQFTQATNQIADWKSWFREPSNISQFCQLYRIPSDWIQSRVFEQKYFLIYGRRSDPSLTDAFNKKRKIFERENECHMTYDRIQPNRYMSDCLTAKIGTEGYFAISIPPTMQLGPTFADYGKLIRGKESAVRANQYLSETRKNFLISRWPYWDAWTRAGVIQHESE